MKVNATQANATIKTQVTIHPQRHDSPMASSLPILTTIATDTWVEATWEEFLSFADDPTLTQAKFYYDNHHLRIEMLPVGSSHGQDNSVVAVVVNVYGAMRGIPIKALTNTSFRKPRLRESQPDLAFYVGDNIQFPPRNNSPISLEELTPPDLVIEIAASSLDDDLERKITLYQRQGTKEYWVVNVADTQVISFALTQTTVQVIRQSAVLPGLEMALVEEALGRSRTEDDGQITRWLIQHLSHPS